MKWKQKYLKQNKFGFTRGVLFVLTIDFQPAALHRISLLLRTPFTTGICGIVRTRSWLSWFIRAMEKYLLRSHDSLTTWTIKARFQWRRRWWLVVMTLLVAFALNPFSRMCFQDKISYSNVHIAEPNNIRPLSWYFSYREGLRVTMETFSFC